eukprot:6975762-Pyramimonas_sp.AAC.1
MGRRFTAVPHAALLIRYIHSDQLGAPEPLASLVVCQVAPLNDVADHLEHREAEVGRAHGDLRGILEVPAVESSAALSTAAPKKVNWCKSLTDQCCFSEISTSI